MKRTQLSRQFIGVTLMAATAITGLVSSQRTTHASQEDESASFQQVEPMTLPEPSLARLPLSFERNVGQSDALVAYLARGQGYGLFLTSSEMVLALQRGAQPGEGADEQAKADRATSLEKAHLAEPERPSILRMRLAGASAKAPVGEQELETRTNYFIGNDPEQWHTDVPNFAKVRYADVYPGVDLVYYGREGALEYDFVVAPGADPSAILMEWEGAEAFDVDADGSLIMRVAGGEVRQSAPLVYQDAEGAKAAVAGSYELAPDGRVGLRIGAYDESKPLVIDPIVYYTVFGGNQWDAGLDIAVDSTGAAYVTGQTFSSNFPTASPYDGSYNNSGDVFVRKLNPAGTAAVYSTFLGGSLMGTGYGQDIAYGIAVNSAGEAHVAGSTDSSNFPTYRAFDSTFNGGLYIPDGSDLRDAFVTKLNAAGNGLVYSTYLGGHAHGDAAFDVALDSAGAVYVTGITFSNDFPTYAAFDPTYGGNGDAFVTKLKLNLLPTPKLRLVYSTYLGHVGADGGWGIAVDGAKSAYVAGYTESSNFPAFLGFDSTYNGAGDGFVTKLNPAGSAITRSSFMGGGGKDRCEAIALDATNASYVTGYTESSILFLGPPVGGFDHSYNGGGDAFAAKVSAPGTTLVYFTYLGGSLGEGGNSIAVDAAGAAYITGSTNSPNFPTATTFFDPTFNGGVDVFVTKLKPAADAMVYSTFWGSSGVDAGAGIAVTPLGLAYVTGMTEPTGALQNPAMAGMNAFVLALPRVTTF